MKQKAAKEKQFKPDIDMLVHKYSDYYEDFVNYDAREIVYPVYKTKVEYIIKGARTSPDSYRNLKNHRLPAKNKNRR